MREQRQAELPSTKLPSLPAANRSVLSPTFIKIINHRILEAEAAKFYVEGAESADCS